MYYDLTDAIDLGSVPCCSVNSEYATAIWAPLSAVFSISAISIQAWLFIKSMRYVRCALTTRKRFPGGQLPHTLQQPWGDFFSSPIDAISLRLLNSSFNRFL